MEQRLAVRLDRGTVGTGTVGGGYRLTLSMELSNIIAGLWRQPEWDLEGAALAAWTRQVLELGVDTVDLADIYGGYTVEEAFGAALRADPGLRRELKLITKCNIKLVSERRPAHRRHGYDSSCAHIIDSAERSLKALGTDHLELLLLHRQDPLMDPDEVAAAFSALEASGKVLAFGVSNFTPSCLDALQSRLERPLVTNQVEASVLHLDPFVDGTLDQALARRFRPMAWSPLGGGRLFSGDGEQEARVRAAVAKVADELGERVDTVAYAFLLRHPTRMRPITGTGRLDRIAAAVRACEVSLSRDQWFELWTASTGAPLP
ncbi:aldo/keto reductase [bacterium]|nr:aldo/keto reductase [bacterium]